MKKVFSFFAGRMFIFFALIAVQALFFVTLLTALGEISMWVQLTLDAIGLLLVLYIVSKKQNPAYKIAWIILIMLLPVFGITMYFFFSQRKLGRKEREKAFEIFEKTDRLMAYGEGTRVELKQTCDDAEAQSDFIANTSYYPPYRNTQATYYPMGEDFFADLVAELEKAERYIYMEYFIIEEGKMWNTVLDIMERKAAQGLDVRLMYDDIGCMSKVPYGYRKTIEAKGIKCVVFNPLRPVLNSLFNNRDHRKITVIDGITGFCGGANLADEYINAVERFGTWKDASVMLKGEGVWPFLMMFAHLWSFMTGEDIETFLPDKPDYSAYKAEGFVQPFADTPLDETYVSEGVYMNMITRAKKYIYIDTPYLIPGNEIVTALTNAAASGVDVRIMVPGIPDKKMVYLVTQSHFAELIRAGVKIYLYTAGFIHSKTFVCDDLYGVVGTINLDFRSLYLNFECGVWMYGTSCIDDLKRDFLETAKAGREVAYADTQNIRWYKRFVRAVLRIFGPMM